MSKVEQSEQKVFHPDGMAERIRNNPELTLEEQNDLVASLGPDAGVFAPAGDPGGRKETK